MFTSLEFYAFPVTLLSIWGFLKKKAAKLFCPLMGRCCVCQHLAPVDVLDSSWDGSVSEAQGAAPGPGALGVTAPHSFQTGPSPACRQQCARALPLVRKSPGLSPAF